MVSLCRRPSPQELWGWENIFLFSNLFKQQSVPQRLCPRPEVESQNLNLSIFLEGVDPARLALAWWPSKFPLVSLDFSRCEMLRKSLVFNLYCRASCLWSLRFSPILIGPHTHVLRFLKLLDYQTQLKISTPDLESTTGETKTHSLSDFT